MTPLNRKNPKTIKIMHSVTIFHINRCQWKELVRPTEVPLVKIRMIFTQTKINQFLTNCLKRAIRVVSQGTTLRAAAWNPISQVSTEKWISHKSKIQFKDPPMRVKKHFTTLILPDTILPITTLKLKPQLIRPRHLYQTLLKFISNMNHRKP